MVDGQRHLSGRIIPPPKKKRTDTHNNFIVPYVKSIGLGIGLVLSHAARRCRLDLVCVQEVRWDKVGTVPAEVYTFLYGEGNENHQLGIFYVREEYHQLKELSLLGVGCGTSC